MVKGRFVRAGCAVVAAAGLTVAFLADHGAPAPVLADMAESSNSGAVAIAGDAGTPIFSPPAHPVRPVTADVADEPVSAVVPVDHRREGAGTSDQATIARGIQRHLKRLGCYDGALTGEWDAATRAAMTTALRRLDADASVAKADIDLLALVEAPAGPLCRSDCGPAPSATASRTCHDPADAGLHRGEQNPAPPNARAVVRPDRMPGMMTVGGPPPRAPIKAATEPGQTSARQADRFFTNPLNRIAD